MRLDELKKSFWGYKKESVHRYISQLEDDASEKLMKKDAQMEQAAEQAKKRIAALEDDLRMARSEIESLRREQTNIAETMLEAQRYVQQIKSQVSAFEQEARAKIQSDLDKQQMELEEYSAMTGDLKQRLQALLQETMEKAEEMQLDIEELKKKSPASRLVDISSLFA